MCTNLQVSRCKITLIILIKDITQVGCAKKKILVISHLLLAWPLGFPRGSRQMRAECCDPDPKPVHHCDFQESRARNHVTEETKTLPQIRYPGLVRLVLVQINTYTSSTAQGGGGSFKVGNLSERLVVVWMAERSHWWIYLSIYLSTLVS